MILDTVCNDHGAEKIVEELQIHSPGFPVEGDGFQGNPGPVPRHAGAGGMTKGRAAIRAEIRCWFEAKRKPAGAKQAAEKLGTG